VRDWLSRPYVPNEPPYSIGSGIGLDPARLVGFRAPYLRPNDHLMATLRARGYLYDSSIEEGWQLAEDGRYYA
jgi:hypothetical protein